MQVASLDVLQQKVEKSAKLRVWDKASEKNMGLAFVRSASV